MDTVYIREHDLIERYVAICNVALSKNAGRFPFKQILEAAEKSRRGRYVAVEFYDSGNCQKYVLSLYGRRIIANKWDDKQEDLGENIWQIYPFDQTWSVSKSYFDDVVENAPKYIENPALLDWEWLYERPTVSTADIHSATFVHKSLHGNSEEQAAQE